MSGHILIGVGLSGVLFDWRRSVSQYLKDAQGLFIPPQSLRTNNFAEMTDDPHVNSLLVKKLEDPNFFAEMAPYPWAWDAVELLADCGVLLAITKRCRKVRSATRISLTAHFAKMIPHITYQESDYAPTRAARYGLNYFFEDSPERCVAFARKGIVAYAVGCSGGPDSHYFRPTVNVLEGAKDLWARIKLPLLMEA